MAVNYDDFQFGNFGYNFPALKESDAMFSAERAPEWKDSEVCNRCRTGFSTFNRKHHCRHCGGVFCGKCSSKSCIIPKFGIEREVRVCESCYENLNKSSEGKEDDMLPSEYLASPLSKQSQAPPTKTEQELQEEEELQLALALSKSEAESQKKTGGGTYNLYGSGNKATEPARAPDPVVGAPTFDTSEMDPELARYLNRNYWQQKAETGSSNNVAKQEVSTTEPTAPAASSSDSIKYAVANSNSGTMVMNEYGKTEETFQNGADNAGREQFLNALEGSIQIFTNRMKSNYSRGRSIANDSSVQTLFMTINQMHPQLLQYVGEQEDVRARYENLQDKLAQLKDAREALDVLREEHREKRRREQEEMDRQRAIQMAHKLEVLRQKKQEYLEYQRQLALQRMAEQKRDMEMRLAQQKQMQMQRAMQYNLPSLSTQMYPQSMSPAGGSAEGSPMHHPHQMQTPYGAPTQQQMMMGAPPGAPGGQMGGPPMTMAMPAGGGMGGPPGAQPMYAGQQAPPGASIGYQAPGGYAPAGYHPGQPQVSYPAPTSSPQPGYNNTPAPTNTTEYSSFNMQGMSASLPPGQPPMSGQQPPGQPPLPGQPLQQPHMGQSQGGPPSMNHPGMPGGQPSNISGQQMMGHPGMMNPPAITQPGMVGGAGSQMSINHHPGMPSLQHMGQPASMPQHFMGQPAPGQPGMPPNQQPPGMQNNQPQSMMSQQQQQQPPQQYMGQQQPQYQGGPPPPGGAPQGGVLPPSGQDRAPPPGSQGQQDVAQLISFD